MEAEARKGPKEEEVSWGSKGAGKKPAGAGEPDRAAPTGDKQEGAEEGAGRREKEEPASAEEPSSEGEEEFCSAEERSPDVEGLRCLRGGRGFG